MSAAEVNPFFEVESIGDEGGWLSLEELPAALDDRVIAVQDYLRGLTDGSVERRVAASIMSLGLYARLLSPTVGAIAVGGTLPQPLMWRPGDGAGPLRLGSRGTPSEPRLQDLLTGVIDALVDEFATRFSVSETIGWGNVASALFGAARMCGADVSAALDTPPLAGTGSIGQGGFVRASCCLYYRVGGGYCGDCILARS